MRQATAMLHGGQQRSSFRETSEAIYMTQGFVYDSAEAAEARFLGTNSGYMYTRYANPNSDSLERKMCLLEGAEDARAVGSGMAAISAAILCQVKAGDHVIAGRALFGSCRWLLENVLPRFGVMVDFVDGTKSSEWLAAIRPQTKLFYIESPANPTLQVTDIRNVVNIANTIGAKVIVDNVFATPIYQKPLELGAHIVVYSATKHIDGQGRCLGGVILARQKEWIDEFLHDYLKHTGPTLSPFNGWLLSKGLETMPLRVRHQTTSAARIADFLADHPAVAHVIYPGREDHPQADVVRRQMTGGSTMISIDLKGGREAAFSFVNALRFFTLSTSLGDAKSLITHPETTTHRGVPPTARAGLGIGAGTLRLSIGLEDADDLIEDIELALSRTG